MSKSSVELNSALHARDRRCQSEVVGAPCAQRVWRGAAPVLCMHTHLEATW